MAILYSYPKANVDGDELLIISDNDAKRSTRSLTLQSVADWLPTYLQIQDFKLYDKSWCKPLPTPLVDQDIIMYSAVSDTWCPAPNPVPTVPTVIIDVQATYDAGQNEYTGVATPPIGAYEEGVIYRITFDVTNSSANSTLAIDGLASITLEFADNTGTIGPITSNYITAGLIYYTSFVNNTFQLSTSAPPASNSAIEYSNSLPSSITSAVGGVDPGDTWAAFPDPVTGVIRGYTLTEIMNRIFYPYQIPTISNFRINPNPSPLEVGDTLVGGVKAFNWSLGFQDNIEDNTLDIKDITTNVTLDTGLPKASPANVDIGSDITYAVQSSHQWQANALTTVDNPSGQATIFSNVFTVNWYYRWYWGSSVNLTLTGNQIVALNPESPTNGNFNDDRTFQADYWYICIPDGIAGWSGLTAWTSGGAQAVPVLTQSDATYNQTDANGYHYTVVNAVPVNGNLGNPIAYRVYRSQNSQGLSDAAIKF